MKMLIINAEIAEKLRQTEFDGFNRLDPVKGDIAGKEVYFLQAELKENKIFTKVLADFEVCEIKEIATIEQKYYDLEAKEITDISKIDTSTAISKTVLTETIIKEPIK